MTAGASRVKRSSDEVERIGELERAFGGSLVEIALLVADIGDDGVAFLLDALALSALERHDRVPVIVIGARTEPRPALESGAIEIPHRRLTLALAAAGDEEYRDIRHRYEDGCPEEGP